MEKIESISVGMKVEFLDGKEKCIGHMRLIDPPAPEQRVPIPKHAKFFHILSDEEIGWCGKK